MRAATLEKSPKCAGLVKKKIFSIKIFDAEAMIINHLVRIPQRLNQCEAWQLKTSPNKRRFPFSIKNIR